MIEAAINGSRTDEEHDALPMTAEGMGRIAAACVAEGATAIHLHVRDADGAESLAAEDVARTLDAVRERCAAPVGVSTGLWITNGDVAKRHELIDGWTTLPDFVSINFDEEGADGLAELLIERGVGIEAGLANVAAAEALVISGVAPWCVRVLIEPPDEDVAEALLRVAEIEEILANANIDRPRLLHGLNATAWPLLEEALRRGIEARIGLEDVLVMSDGSPAAGNAALVAAAAAMRSS